MVKKQGGNLKFPPCQVQLVVHIEQFVKNYYLGIVYKRSKAHYNHDTIQ